jgi:hypothetical protein
METIIAAAITGSLTLLGVWVTVQGSRRTSTSQHNEQTRHLVAIEERQNVMLDTVHLHRDMAEQQFNIMNDRVDGLLQSHETLFNMVVDVDSKVTKPAKKKMLVETETTNG